MSEFPLIGQGGLENLVDSLGDVRVRFGQLAKVQQNCPKITEIELGVLPPSDIHEPLVHMVECAFDSSSSELLAPSGYRAPLCAAFRRGPQAARSTLAGVKTYHAFMRTLVQQRLPVKVVIYNNGTLGFVEIEQKVAGLLDFGTDLVNPNFAKVAEAVGVLG